MSSGPFVYLGIVLGVLLPTVTASVLQVRSQVRSQPDPPPQVCHYLSLSIISLLLGYPTTTILTNVFEETEPTITRVCLIHSLLAFIFLSDLECARSYFDRGDLHASYPDMVPWKPHMHYSLKWLDEQETNYKSFPFVFCGWRSWWVDVFLSAWLFAINYCLNRGAKVLLGTGHVRHEARLATVGFNVLHASGGGNACILGLILLRPVRLLSGFILACLVKLWDKWSRYTAADEEKLVLVE